MTETELVNRMENLLCAEKLISDPVRGIEDKIFGQLRTGQCMLFHEEHTTPRFDYFKLLQDNLLPYMRKVVSTWMHAVCSEQNCESTVFSLAMNLLDRFLCTTQIQKTQLQLVGAVCLLIATKMRQVSYLSLPLLSEYSEFSISVEELQEWELIVASKLKWDLCPVIPNDFVDYYFQRCHIPLSNNCFIRKHTLTIVALLLTDHSSITMKPSLIAVAAMGAAARGLGYMFDVENMVNLSQEKPDIIEKNILYIENLLKEAHNNSEVVDDQKTPRQDKYDSQGKTVVDSEYYEVGEAPTDVSEIGF